MKKNNKKNDKSYNSNVKKNNSNNKNSINDSDSEDEIPKILSPRKTKPNKNKNEANDKMKNQKLLGSKHKINDKNFQKSKKNEFENENKNKSFSSDLGYKSPKKLKKPSFLSDSDTSSPKLISNKNNNINNNNINNNNINNDNNNVIKIKDEDEDDDYIEFPFEYTQKVVEALTCEYCKGLYIRPYVINALECMHVFCLGCILKILEDKEIGICPKCNTQFILKDIKYSEVTDYYIKTFFPQVPKIIEENRLMLNKFMESEAQKYSEKPNNNIIILTCELKPYKKNITLDNRLPDIVGKNNRFMIQVKSDEDNIVSILKKQTIKRLNLKLKEEELEIRCEDVELSLFKTYSILKEFLKTNQIGIITFHYNRKAKNK